MAKGKPVTNQSHSSAKALQARERLFRLFEQRPMGDEELLVNLGLYMRSGALAKLLFLDEMYRQILHLPGVVMEFGVWRGQDLAVFENLRAVHEPYNYNRRVIGFDTFTGYQGRSSKDKDVAFTRGDAYAVGAGYQAYLDGLLDYHESENVMSHVRKHELVKGDASLSCPRWLRRHPEALVALAYFDMALYKPTLKCLQAIKPRLMKGSLVVLDELGHPDYPGETQALMQVLGLRGHEIRRSAILPDRGYVVVA